MNSHTLRFTQPLTADYAEILNPEAQSFLVELCQQFAPRLDELMTNREQAQKEYDKGALPDFDPTTKDIRDGNWRVADIPTDLQKRHLEITGPVERKMIINALNADVDVFMADFEDSLSPTWHGMMQGQVNLRDANLGTITFTDQARGKHYTLDPNPAL
ncbi:MAG TPA: malate synthase A, partial [Aliidiomarina sp.]|nr:malate synthase A [Aliidiomarina sp.]